MKAGTIRRSIQRFEDYSRDLRNADMNSFEDRLKLLISFCKIDDFFSKIDAQLINSDAVDFDAWYNSLSRRQLKFPTNIDERLSIMYQLLCRFDSKDINYLSFCFEYLVVGSNKIDPHIYSLNEIVCEPLFRELAYRLEDVQDELPHENSDEVSTSVFQIIHYAENVIQQSVSGNGNTLSASIKKSNNDLDRLFSDLKAEIGLVGSSKHEVQENMELIAACEDLAKQENPKKGAVKKLLDTLPTLGNVASVVSAILAAI